MVYTDSFDRRQIALFAIPSAEFVGMGREIRERRRMDRHLPVPEATEGNSDSDWALWTNAVLDFAPHSHQNDVSDLAPPMPTPYALVR
jgi:hypothetical protein